MDGRKAFLACLVLVSYLSRGRTTKEANSCWPDIPCDDGQCIGRDDWCDNHPHCYDDSDESYCKIQRWYNVVDNKCNATLHFLCANNQCVPKVLECDGIADCEDNSDEKNCLEDGKQVIEHQEPVTTSSLLPDSKGDVPFPDSLTKHTPDSFTRGNGHDHSVTTELVSTHKYDSGGSVPRPDSRTTQAPFHPYEYDRRGSVPRSDPRATQAPVSHHEYDRGGSVPYPDPRAYPGTTLRHAWPLPVFRFQVDRQESFARRYGGALLGAEDWLLSREVTPRTLVTLSLARNSLRPNTTQYEVMRRTLRLRLGAKLLGKGRSSSVLSDSLDVHELSTYVTALLATCQDPRRVYGQDVVSLLRNHPRSRTPSVLLALCLADASIVQEDFRLLQGAVDLSVVDEVSKDRFILSTSALACLHKRGLYSNELRSVLGAASRKLLELQYDDGSFGSIYSTALAAQALFALDSKAWNPDRTLDFVMGHRALDGSFGDTLATSLVLPVLAGRSLLHLRETQCENPEEEIPPEVDGRIFDGRTKTVRYTVTYGRDRITLPVTVPVDASFFETMQEAQKLHPRFRFMYTETFGKPDVYSLSGVANDPERGTYWQLFVQDRIYEGDIRQLVPGDNEELLYRYLPYRRSFPSTQYTQPKQLDIIWD